MGELGGRSVVGRTLNQSWATGVSRSAPYGAGSAETDRFHVVLPRFFQVAYAQADVVEHGRSSFVKRRNSIAGFYMPGANGIVVRGTCQARNLAALEIVADAKR